MKNLSRPTFLAWIGLGPAHCLWLVLGCGLACTVAAQANPNLYVCPGPLFTNDLAPALAKARGCELAAQGRLSQALNPPGQDLPTAETEARSALAETAPGLASAPSQIPTPARPLAATSAALGAAPVPTAATAARQIAQPNADASRQRQRDSHAREIVLAELARTQARIQSFSAQPPSGPEAESALQRLKRDEDALRRELARRPG
jgi:hypothetical protein